MSNKMIVTLKCSLILLVVIVAAILSLNILDLIDAEQMQDVLIKMTKIWLICSVAILAITFIAKPKSKDKGE